MLSKLLKLTLLTQVLSKEILLIPHNQNSADQLIKLSQSLAENENLASKVLPADGALSKKSKGRFSLMRFEKFNDQDDQESDANIVQTYALYNHLLDDQNKLLDFVTSAFHSDLPFFLNDETFEHDTQATTGSTTGDWFVTFYTDKTCLEKVEPIILSAKNNLEIDRSHVIFGFVEKKERSRLTFKRFNIQISSNPDDTSTPCFQSIYISKSNVYYMDEFKLYAIEDFVQGGHRGSSKIMAVPGEVREGGQNSFDLNSLTIMKIAATIVGIIGLIMKILEAKGKKERTE